MGATRVVGARRMIPDSRSFPTKPEAMERSRRVTLAALLQVSDSTLIKLTRLTLPEIRAIQKEISQIFPAGNLPAFVLSGLLKLKGRRVSLDQVRRDLTALLRGINLIPEGLYGVFFAGPAAALYAYQKLLQLAGKDPVSAFPEGTWQFYLQFGLREDAARHASETVGCHRALPPQPDPVAMAAAWVCAALELLYRYDDLLATDWMERVTLRLAMEEATEVGVADQPPFASMVRDWTRQCPYHRPPGGSDYIPYRQATFQHFLQERLQTLPPAVRESFGERYQARRHAELAAYQKQMALLAFLEPDRYQERKELVSLWQAAIGFVWQGHTYLLPVCQQDEQGSPLCCPPSAEGIPPIPLYVLPGGELCDTDRQPLVVGREGQVWFREGGRLLGVLRPPKPEAVLGWLAAIFAAPSRGAPPTLDLLLVESPRALQSQLRGKLPDATQKELDLLRRAPILLNWDLRPYELPLAYIRRDRRGIGDHALTLFRTGRSMVFDQSHIFFDGIWGMAVAEIMTDNATHWYHRLAGQPHVPQVPAPQPLRLTSNPEVEALAQSHRQRREVTAEAEGVDTHRLFRLREWLQQRGVRLTVNDLLLLWRFFHAAEYRPASPVLQALEAFRHQATSPEARAAWQSIETTLARLRETNPALLIPMDASRVSPRERVFPTTFRNPLTEIRDRFVAAQERYRACHAHPDPYHGSTEPVWAAFDQARRELLAYLKAFGELLDTLKAVTMRGESFNTATIRLLAHLPPSMQHLMDQIPQRIGVLNEIIKGNEVFSNVGRVAPGTSLTRFLSAKDDGETKELIWGVLTDDQDRMRISLRDFRPFVSHLLALGETTLADMLAQDYLESYVTGFNRFVVELSDLVTEKAPSEG